MLPCGDAPARRRFVSGTLNRLGHWSYGAPLGALALLLSVGVPCYADDPKAAEHEAAERSFARGKELYEQGSFAQAIESFQAAYDNAPHPSALFNIARCHENLGDAAAALEYYRRALASPEIDAALRDNAKRRVADIERRPVRVLVSSSPDGASLTVNGRSEPEPKSTPLVLRLTPGQHLLALRRDGFALTAKRIQVEPGKEQTVRVELERPEEPSCPPPPPCPPDTPCPDLQLTDFRDKHLHVSLQGAFMLAAGWGVVSGPAAELKASFGQLMVGTALEYLPVGEDAASTVQWFTDSSAKLVTVHLDGGWVFPFQNFYLFASGLIGFYWDSIAATESVEAGRSRSVNETSGFSWGLAGGIQTMIVRWLSMGATLRLGVMHGNRVDPEQPERLLDDHHFPYGSLTTGIAFHL